MNPVSCFFKKMLRLPKKLRLSITFSLWVQIEWNKASHVDKNTACGKKNLINSDFLWFFCVAHKPQFLFIVP